MVKNIKCVLLVEDDPVAAFLGQTLLETFCKLECINIAANGAEALDSLLKNPVLPSLILLDLRMPVMDGFEFLKEFQSLPVDKTNIKIVVLSSSWRDDDKQKALELGAVDYIVKPNNEKKMQMVVENHF